MRKRLASLRQQERAGLALLFVLFLAYLDAITGERGEVQQSAGLLMGVSLAGSPGRLPQDSWVTMALERRDSTQGHFLQDSWK
jgi:hypothetical protein